MKKILGTNLYNDQSRTVLTLGMFDGVHNGHKAIVEKLNDIARKRNAKSGLLTFSPHPRFVLQKDSELKLLTLENEKEEILNSLGLDYMFVQPFDKVFSEMSSLNFVKKILVEKLKVEVLIIGHDHHFGKNREGNFDRIKELSQSYGFEVKQLEAVITVDKPISSTKIRNALISGDISYANQALGYSYFLQGKVISGDGIGRNLGYPTINLDVDSKKLIPKDGVYGTKTIVGGKSYFGLMSIGDRPTFEGKDKRIEVHILDYAGDLYKENVRVEILCFLRNQLKFSNVDELKVAMQNDEKTFRNFIQKKTMCSF